MTKSLALTLALFGIAISAAAQSPDPKPVLAEFQQINLQAQLDAKAGKKTSRADIMAAFEIKSKAAIQGIDYRTIKPEDAADWSLIFGYAGLKKEAGALSATAAQYYTFKAWESQQVQLDSLVDEGKGEEVVNLLRFAIASEVRMLAQLGETVHGSITNKFGKTQPQIVLASYDALLTRLDPNGLVSPVDRQWGDICFANVTANKCDFLFRQGRTAEAYAGLHALKVRFAKSTSSNAYGAKPLDVIDGILDNWGAVREPAPKLAFQTTIGNFPGIEALKGKVVLLDFFAHWCGPCRRAFPEMREIYARYKPQGLELVGMTSYYGYFDTEKGLSQTQELVRMRSFVKDNNMTWPVAIDATKSNEKAFNVTAIPHLTIIDKKGMIRMVTVGYDPSDRERIEAFIQKLLAEKA